MWGKGKFCRLKLIKKILFFLILFTLFSQKSFSLPKEKIINNFIKINNISFEFHQKIDELNQETETLIDEIEKWQT